MKVNKSLLTAVIVSGSLGMAPGLVQADGDQWRYDEPQAQRSGGAGETAHEAERGFSFGGNGQEMTQSEALKMEGMLADRGYGPGAVDGIIDSDTRAAIQEFQDDHQLAATGVIDPKTGELLGIVVFESS